MHLRKLLRLPAVVALLFIWPAFVLAQETTATTDQTTQTAPPPAPSADNPDPASVADNLPQSSTFWGVFLVVVALPFFGKALNYGFDLFIAWQKSKATKRGERIGRTAEVIRAAISYVNAQTKSTQDAIRAPDSELGTKVSSHEAKLLQDDALHAVKSWLGTEGIKAAVQEAGIAIEGAEPYFRGLIQREFEMDKLAKQAALTATPVVNISPS